MGSVLFSGLLMVGGQGYAEQGDELFLEGGQGGWYHGDGVAVVVDGGDGQGCQDLQDPGGAGRGAGAAFVVEGQLGQAGLGHGGADLAFGQGVDEQGGVQAEAQGVDAGVVLQLQRGGVQDAFEGGVTALDAGLVLVGGEDLGGGQGVVVGDEGEAAIGCGVAGGKGGIGGGGQGAAGAGDGGVAGGRAGPAGADLAAGDGVVAGDGAADPTARGGRGDDLPGCGGDGLGGLELAAGRVQACGQGVQAGGGPGDPVRAGGGVRGLLGRGADPGDLVALR